MEEIEGGQLRRLSAFSTDAAGGNPAGVWIGPSLPTSDRMQEMAKMVGFSETAFLATEGDGRFATRYYAPISEVSFCGHATIAAGVVLGELHGNGTYVLDTTVGDVPVEVSEDSGHRMAALTSVTPEHRPADSEIVDQALDLLGWGRSDLDRSIPPALAYAGAWHLVLALSDRLTLSRLSYPFQPMRSLMIRHGLTTIQVIWRESDGVFHARDPFPVGGVVEDPATGAAAAALGGYLRDTGLITAPTSFEIEQGLDMGRPSRLTVEVPLTGGIVVSGPAVDLDR